MAFFYCGGGERVVIEEAKKLREHGHEVRVFGCLVDYTKCFPQELKQTNPQSIAQLPRWVPHREAASMFLSTMTGKRREFAGHAKDVDTRSLMGAAACLFNSKWTKELIREEYGINGEVCYPGCDHVPVMP